MNQAPLNLAVLFADISGSAKLYENLGDTEALATIDRVLAIVKQICVDGGGRVVKTIGDEVMAVFPTADDAAHAATEMQSRISVQRTSRGVLLAIHVGFHYGPAIEEASDVFGDSVTVASRLTSLAKGGQIFTSAETHAMLSPTLHTRTRDQDAHTIKGKQKDVGVRELIWQEAEEEMTMLSPRLVLRPAHLKLTHGDRALELGEATSVLTLGRDAQSDVVIFDRKASRMHARIERRRDKFALIDHSSNGTYVTVEGEGEVVLRREEMILRGSGHISFGHAYEDDPVEFIGFSCGT